MGLFVFHRFCTTRRLHLLRAASWQPVYPTLSAFQTLTLGLLIISNISIEYVFGGIIQEHCHAAAMNGAYLKAYMCSIFRSSDYGLQEV